MFENRYVYTLAASGIKFRPRTYETREYALKKMYSFIAKKKLHIQEIYDDKHFKTYCCENNIRFYIQRDY